MPKEIPLTQGKVAIVDDADFDMVNQYKWQALNANTGKWYAVRGVGWKDSRKTIYMHRFIMDTPRGMEVDHKDGNGLNCQRDNMRNCSHAQNMKNIRGRSDNTSGYRGVSFSKAARKWQAMIMANGKRHYIGLFDAAIDAAMAYDLAAREHHGAFARPNFPPP